MNKYILDILGGAPVLRELGGNHYYHFGLDPKLSDSYDPSMDTSPLKEMYSSGTFVDSFPTTGSSIYLPSTLAGEAVATGHITFDDSLFPTTDYSGAPAGFSLDPLQVLPYPDIDGSGTLRANAHLIKDVAAIDVTADLYPGGTSYTVTASVDGAGNLRLTRSDDPNWTPGRGEAQQVVGLVAEADTTFTNDGANLDELYVFFDDGASNKVIFSIIEPAEADFSGVGWGEQALSVAESNSVAAGRDNLGGFYASTTPAADFSANSLNGQTWSIDDNSSLYVKYIPNTNLELLEASNQLYDVMESGDATRLWEFDPSVPSSAMADLVDLLSLTETDLLFASVIVAPDHPSANLVDLGEGLGEQHVSLLAGNVSELYGQVVSGFADGTIQAVFDIGEYRGTATDAAAMIAEYEGATQIERDASFVTLDAMVKLSEVDVNAALVALGVDPADDNHQNLIIQFDTDYVDTLVVSDTTEGEAADILRLIRTTDTAEANMWGDSTSLKLVSEQPTLSGWMGGLSTISDIAIVNSSAGAVDFSRSEFSDGQIVTLTADTASEFIYHRNIDPGRQWQHPDSVKVGDGVTFTLKQDFASTPQFNIVNEGTGVVEFVGLNNDGETIYGTTGADTIIGGAGDDTLHGVSGADTFVFNTDGLGAGDGNDIIIGYDDSKGGDTIIIQNGSNALSQAASYQEYLDSAGATYFVDASGNYEYSGGTITLAEAQGLVSATESKFEIVELKDERAGDIMTYGVKVKDAYAWSEFSSVKFGIEWDASKYTFVENSVVLSHNAAMLDLMSVPFDPGNPNHPYYHNAANGFLDFSITGGIDGNGDPTSQTFTHTEYSINWGDMPNGGQYTRLKDVNGIITLTGNNAGVYATAKDGMVSFENETGALITLSGMDLDAAIIELVSAVHIPVTGNGTDDEVYLAYQPLVGVPPLTYYVKETSDGGFYDQILGWTTPEQKVVTDDYVAKFTMKRIDPAQAINELVLKYSNDSVIYYDNDGNEMAVASTPNSEASVFDYTTDQVSVNVRDADGHSSTTPTKLYVSSDTVSDGLSLVPVMQVGDLVKYNVVMNVASPTLRYNAIEDMPMHAQIWITGAEIFEDSVMQIGYADMGNAGWDNDPAMPDTPPFVATAGTKALTAKVADSQFDFIKNELEGATDLTGVNVTHQLEISQSVGGLYPTTSLITRSVDPDAPAVAQHAVAEFWARVDGDGIGFSYRNFTSDDMSNDTTKSYTSAISITSTDITGGSDTFTVNDGSNVAVLGDTLYKNPFSNMMAIDNADSVRALQVAVDDPMDRKFDAATYVAADFDKDGKVTGADAYNILISSAFYSPTDFFDPMDPAYYNALLSTPDWMFVEHDYQNGVDLIDLNTGSVTTDPYFGSMMSANSVSFDRYFNKFVGETSKFDVTAILSGDANHSYIPANGSSAHLADYESILGLANTANDVTAPGAETFIQATTVVPAGGGVTVTDAEFSFSSTDPGDVIAVPGAIQLSLYEDELINIGSELGLTEVVFTTTADGGVNFAGTDAASIDTIEEVVDATELVVEELETNTGFADTIVAYWTDGLAQPSTYVMVFDETTADSGSFDLSDIYLVGGAGIVSLVGTEALPPNVEGNLIIDTFIA